MTDLEKANAVLSELVEELCNAQTRQSEAEEAAREYAFPAHTGDLAARKELDRLNATAAKAAAEIKGLEAAVSQAQLLVDDAMAADLDERERDDARKALALLGDFERRGEELQQAMDKFISKYEETTRDFRALGALGYPVATWLMLKIQMNLATQSSLQFTDLKIGDFLAPSERRDFRSVLEGWAGSVRGKIQARINRSPRKAA
jgi:hypothetical protein